MRYSIRTRILDILEKDTRIFRGGEAWPAGFSGVQRVKTFLARPGYVNLFDHIFQPEADDMRPAVYVGTKKSGGRDVLQGVRIGQRRSEDRIFHLPIVAVAQAPNRLDAERMADQLHANIVYILMEDTRQDGAYYDIGLPGGAGVDLPEFFWSEVAASGPGMTVVEAGSTVPVAARYTRVAGGDTP